MKVHLYCFGKRGLLKRSRIRSIVSGVLRRERRHFSDVNIIIADDHRMTRLNRMFFGKNSPTNVISFNLGDLCEIYVAQKQIREGPDAYYFIVHGLLHAVGYDHKTRREGALMDKKCREYAGIDDCGK